MNPLLASDEQSRALRDSLSDEFRKLREETVGDHRADVGAFEVGFVE